MQRVPLREGPGSLVAEQAGVSQTPPGLSDPPKGSRTFFSSDLVRPSEVRPCMSGPVGLERDESRTAHPALRLPMRLGAASRQTQQGTTEAGDGTFQKRATTSSLCIRLPGSGGPALGPRRASPIQRISGPGSCPPLCTRRVRGKASCVPVCVVGRGGVYLETVPPAPRVAPGDAASWGVGFGFRANIVLNQF